MKKYGVWGVREVPQPNRFVPTPRYDCATIGRISNTMNLVGMPYAGYQRLARNNCCIRRSTKGLLNGNARDARGNTVLPPLPHFRG